MRKQHRVEHGGEGRPKRRGAITAFCVALVATMLGLGLYIAHWYVNLGRIRAEGEQYARLYGVETAATPSEAPAFTPVPTVTATAKSVTPRPTEKPTQVPTGIPTLIPTTVSTVAPTEAMPVAVDVPLPTRGEDMPVAVDVPKVSSQPDMPVAMDVPIPTPNADTLVLPLPTAPPVQSSFEGLLSVNAETIGFLNIEGVLSLPVVQRQNDNDYYLDHSFQGAKASEGTLFLDGLNRLTPEDDCLIVYGHNMKNKTMFGNLSAYGDVAFLRQHPVIRFDTLYENRNYVAFAAFTASMVSGDSRYFDVRRFIFEPDSFDQFVETLKYRSVYDVPVEVRYGDRLLLLVTCDYTNREGRFILALRQVRGDETETGLWARVMGADGK